MLTTLPAGDVHQAGFAWGTLLADRGEDWCSSIQWSRGCVPPLRGQMHPDWLPAWGWTPPGLEGGQGLARGQVRVGRMRGRMRCWLLAPALMTPAATRSLLVLLVLLHRLQLS